MPQTPTSVIAAMFGRDIGAVVLAASAGIFLAVEQASAQHDPIPLPRPRPVVHQPMALPSLQPNAEMPFTAVAPTIPAAALAYARPDRQSDLTPAETASAAEIEKVRQAAVHVQRGRFGDATTLKESVADPVTRKLIEWIILRGDPNHSPGFERYAGFTAENPGWPSIGLLRRRAEAALWDDNRDGATVLRYFATATPLSAKGHFVYARALAANGDRRRAERHVRQAWHSEALAPALETAALGMFSAMLRPIDHRIRMHRLLYSGDVAGATRAAQRLDRSDLAIAKAWIAVQRNARNAKALLDSVPANARSDPAYIFARARWLRRNGNIAEAAKLLLSAPKDVPEKVDSDQWWIERRVLVRALLESGDAKTAYHVARDAIPPQQGNYRVDHEFTAGWVALRFLNDPATAIRHFARLNAVAEGPTALARAGYWQGRAAEAAGQPEEARRHYAHAARFRSAYYGQLARARLGESEIALPPSPLPNGERRAALARNELIRALGMLYAAGERDLAIPFVIDAASRIPDAGAITLLGEIARQNKDARAMLLIGRAALNRGFALYHYAFPDIGVPAYKPIGPDVDPSLLYAIVRQESAFQPHAVSSASALGLMQVMPATGRGIARRAGIAYSRDRLAKDSVYNVQMGAAELGHLLQQYRGSYILAFVGYNAGPGRVREWIERFGDPRDPKVDPIDWIERIPFSETRNYVQRIMENMQVYRARFGSNRQLSIEADLRRGASRE